MEKKQRHRDNVTFQDYAQDARKTYKRQTSNMAVDLEAYEKKKMEAIERAAASGGLEIVETDDGELVAVDKDGTFYSTADSTDFAQNKPSREAVDRLVADMKKAEDVKLKRRLARGKGDDDGDVTYINDKNKHFNQKLARFYNKVSLSSKFLVLLEKPADIYAVHCRHQRQLRTRHGCMKKLFRAKINTLHQDTNTALCYISRVFPAM